MAKKSTEKTELKPRVVFQLDTPDWQKAEKLANAPRQSVSRYAKQIFVTHLDKSK